MNTKIISIGLLALTLFVGCSLIKNQNNESSSQGTRNPVDITISTEAEKLSEIENGGDISKCEELTLEGFRRQCEANIQHEKEAKETPPLPERKPKPPRT